MEGLGEMMSAVVVGSWRVGGSAAIGSAAAQLEPLRHCLTAAQISPDGLHKASLYLQMLTMTSDVRLYTCYVLMFVNFESVFYLIIFLL